MHVAQSYYITIVNYIISSYYTVGKLIIACFKNYIDNYNLFILIHLFYDKNTNVYIIGIELYRYQHFGRIYRYRYSKIRPIPIYRYRYRYLYIHILYIIYLHII
jgi:hypothetical protein